MVDRYPEPVRKISRTTARRFLLAHHWLWPPRRLNGKRGVLAYIRRVGCIQYDPINITGRNPDLVLQSRISGYRPLMLEQLLYKDRKLIDGWDKMASIIDVQDWPYFSRFRAYMVESHGNPDNPPMTIAEKVLGALDNLGPLSSIDFKDEDRLDWAWGRPARLVRASLEVLYAMGDIGVHHKVNTRRVFDRIERLLPEEILQQGDPNQTVEAYHSWHVYRRVGGLGLANPGSGEMWGGMMKVDGTTRRDALTNLVETGQLITIEIEDVSGQTFFMRKKDLKLLSSVEREGTHPRGAAIIAPLDNLIWDRKSLKWIFDFDYAWEVYKPAAQRKYGYYVLPVLYGDQFVGRFEPKFDKKSRQLVIKDWWWESGHPPIKTMESALVDCIQAFGEYLNAGQIKLGDQVRGRHKMNWFPEKSGK